MSDRRKDLEFGDVDIPNLTLRAAAQAYYAEREGQVAHRATRTRVRQALQMLVGAMEDEGCDVETAPTDLLLNGVGPQLPGSATTSMMLVGEIKRFLGWLGDRGNIIPAFEYPHIDKSKDVAGAKEKDKARAEAKRLAKAVGTTPEKVVAFEKAVKQQRRKEAKAEHAEAEAASPLALPEAPEPEPVEIFHDAATETAAAIVFEESNTMSASASPGLALPPPPPPTAATRKGAATATRGVSLAGIPSGHKLRVWKEENPGELKLLPTEFAIETAQRYGSVEGFLFNLVVPRFGPRPGQNDVVYHVAIATSHGCGESSAFPIAAPAQDYGAAIGMIPDAAPPMAVPQTLPALQPVPQPNTGADALDRLTERFMALAERQQSQPSAEVAMMLQEIRQEIAEIKAARIADARRPFEFAPPAPAAPAPAPASPQHETMLVDLLKTMMTNQFEAAKAKPEPVIAAPPPAAPQLSQTEQLKETLGLIQIAQSIGKKEEDPVDDLRAELDERFEKMEKMLMGSQAADPITRMVNDFERLQKLMPGIEPNLPFFRQKERGSIAEALTPLIGSLGQALPNVLQAWAQASAARQQNQQLQLMQQMQHAQQMAGMQPQPMPMPPMPQSQMPMAPVQPTPQPEPAYVRQLAPLDKGMRKGVFAQQAGDLKQHIDVMVQPADNRATALQLRSMIEAAFAGVEGAPEDSPLRALGGQLEQIFATEDRDVIATNLGVLMLHVGYDADDVSDQRLHQIADVFLRLNAGDPEFEGLDEEEEGEAAEEEEAEEEAEQDEEQEEQPAVPQPLDMSRFSLVTGDNVRGLAGF